MAKTKIYIIDGPNLNRLGKRDKGLYGNLSGADIQHRLLADFGSEFQLIFFQHNGEGEIINQIQHAADDPLTRGLIINPGAYAHYSYAIADALTDFSLSGVPAIEVHLTNIAAREEFRRTSVTASGCKAVISGFGPHVYHLALYALKSYGL